MPNLCLGTDGTVDGNDASGRGFCFVAQAATNGPLPLSSFVGRKEKAGPGAIRAGRA